MGEILSESEKHKGGRPTENQLHDATSFIPKLADVGIEKMESHRYQQMAVEAKERLKTSIQTLPNN